MWLAFEVMKFKKFLLRGCPFYGIDIHAVVGAENQLLAMPSGLRKGDSSEGVKGSLGLGFRRNRIQTLADFLPA